MSIECYDVLCRYHGVNAGEEGPFCNENECKNPPLMDMPVHEHGFELLKPIMVDCPYCGVKIPEGTAEAPADYCSHSQD